MAKPACGAGVTRCATKAKEDVHLKTLKALVLIAFVLTTAFALAANMQISLNNANQLNGTTINPGSYKLSYTTSGSTTEVNVLQGKKTIASATGEMVEIQTAPQHDSVISKMNPDGTRTIYEIQFAGKKQAIRFNNEPAVGK
jgi:YD repeat-containing protein